MHIFLQICKCKTMSLVTCEMLCKMTGINVALLTFTSPVNPSVLEHAGICAPSDWQVIMTSQSLASSLRHCRKICQQASFHPGRPKQAEITPLTCSSGLDSRARSKYCCCYYDALCQSINPFPLRAWHSTLQLKCFILLLFS